MNISTEIPNPESKTNHLHFHIVDYVILVLLLLLSLVIGVYHACWGGRQKTTNEYFKGNQKMGIVPVVLSLLASFISSHGILGVPAEVYHQGFNYWFTVLGCALGVPLSSYCFLPVFYDLQITSVYEYLQRRFCRTVRICGSILSIVTLMTFGSFVIYGPALALSQVTGLSLWGSILTTTIIGTVYTSMGGIKAVMWTDSMQMVVFTIALFLCIIKGTIDVGGPSYVISKAIEGNRLHPLSFSIDPRVRFSFWGIFISTTLGYTYGYGVCQLQIQRYLTCPSKQMARKGLWLNTPGLVFVTTTYCFFGLVLYAKNWNCDPLSSGQIEMPDQIFPLFVMNVMGAWPGLPGLFVAGVYSASLSTISSILNSLAAITVEDYVRPRWKDLTDEKVTTISKFIATLYGALCLTIVAGIMNSEGIIQAIFYVTGVTYAVEFSLFTMGLLMPWTNSKGCLIGMICGLSLSTWISVGIQVTKPSFPSLPVSTEGCDDLLGNWTLVPKETKDSDVLEIYKISYLWLPPLGWFTATFIGAIISPLFGKGEDVGYELYSPPVRYILRRRNVGKEKLKDCRECSGKNNHELGPLMENGDMSYAIVTSNIKIEDDSLITNNLKTNYHKQINNL